MRSDTKKMVFLVFPRKKMVLDGKTNFFPRKKMVLDRKTNFFLGKKMVLDRKTHFFLGKTQKTKKNILWETMRPNSKKMFFFGFP